ncbi:MAG: formylglycine-generating enzyme family protein [Myxococcales bacterium]|nr:formylglycine-generating enzyme family protein [Myxococcales bacterium]
MNHLFHPVLMTALLAMMVVGCAEGKPAPPATEMVNITTGLTFQFGMGRDGCNVPSDEQCSKNPNQSYNLGYPSLQVTVAAFAFDIHEVTIEQYRYCVEMEVCSEPAGDNTSGIPNYWAKLAAGGGTVPNEAFSAHPVVQVSWLQAQEYCAFVNKRLPTEQEWERVAGGAATNSATKRVYPFGAPGPQPHPGKCADKNVNLYGCTLLDRPKAVMTSLGDVVNEGGAKVYDLFGNAYEWTASDGLDEVTCDAKQPYDCQECVACLNTGKTRQGCKPQCKSCACGDGDTESKPNCYLPCESPICAVYKAGDLPVSVPQPANYETAQRVIRGGSFFQNSGLKATAPCEGRSDERGFTWRATDPHEGIGFRCAKSL